MIVWSFPLSECVFWGYHQVLISTRVVIPFEWTCMLGISPGVDLCMCGHSLWVSVIAGDITGCWSLHVWSFPLSERVGWGYHPVLILTCVVIPFKWTCLLEISPGVDLCMCGHSLWVNVIAGDIIGCWSLHVWSFPLSESVCCGYHWVLISACVVIPFEWTCLLWISLGVDLCMCGPILWVNVFAGDITGCWSLHVWSFPLSERDCWGYHRVLISECNGHFLWVKVIAGDISGCWSLHVWSFPFSERVCWGYHRVLISACVVIPHIMREGVCWGYLRCWFLLLVLVNVFAENYFSFLHVNPSWHKQTTLVQRIMAAGMPTVNIFYGPYSFFSKLKSIDQPIKYDAWSLDVVLCMYFSDGYYFDISIKETYC